jgi:hypothetical protein
MTALLERGTVRSALEPARTVRVRLGSDSSRIRASCWEEAARLRRRLHRQGWTCTSPCPNGGQNEFTFFVAKSPATVRRDLRSDLESLSEIDLVFEETESSSAKR